MPSLYVHEAGARDPKKVGSYAKADLGRAINGIIAAEYRKGRSVRGCGAEFTVFDRRTGEVVRGYFTNEISGSHDEVSGPRPDLEAL